MNVKIKNLITPLLAIFGVGTAVRASKEISSPTLNNLDTEVMPTKNYADVDLLTLTTAQGLKIIGANLNDYSGNSVSGAGDVNGDGYDDVIIGGYQADPYDRIDAGTSYIIFGKATGFSDIDLATDLAAAGQGFKAFGAATDDYSGASVSSAGDVNGDGYNDVIIGSYGADPYNRIGAGTSYIIFGKEGKSFSDIDLAIDLAAVGQGFKVFGAASGEASGASVSSAGDVNGDGYDDVIIGAPYADPYARDGAGTSYIIFGKATGFSDIDLAIDLAVAGQGFKVFGAASGDYSGGSVSEAGDVNGDGYDDVITGANLADADDKVDAGISYIIFGRERGFSDIDLATSLTGTAQGFKVFGAEQFDQSGNSVSGAGDINGDGYDDIIIGASWAADSNAGTSYIIFGKNNSGFSNIDLSADLVTTDQGFKIFGTNDFDLSGGAVSSAGDINGDGFDDVIIGAPYADPYDRIDAGTSYIIFGQASNFSDIYLVSNLTDIGQGFKIYGAVSIDSSGISVSNAGDINGDGYDDVIIGASGPEFVNSGISYVIIDSLATLAPTAFPTRNPTLSPTRKPTMPYRAASDLDLAELTLAQGFKAIGASGGDWSGVSVSGAGDFNGDGYDDVIIGAYYSDPYERNAAGTSYIIFGKLNGFNDIDLASNLSAVSQGFKVFGAVSNDQSGFSVSGAGDINGDGHDDIIIGAYAAEGLSGTSYIIFGKENSFSDIDLAINLINTGQGFKVFGAYWDDRSGYAVSGVGDVNGDGFDDVIIGAPEADPYGRSSAGTSYIIFGKAIGFGDIDLANDLSATAQGFKIFGANNFDKSGTAVSGVGDINGDDFDDVIIGAPNQESSMTGGTSYIIFGKANNFTDIDLANDLAASGRGFKVFSANWNDHSGVSVSGAGDLNGDGYYDVIIGATGADPYARDSAGASYIIFGKASNFTDIDLANDLAASGRGFKVFGAASGDYSGGAVSGSGDVNGDGYDDVIIGATGANSYTRSDAGTSYVIFGKAEEFTDIDLADNLVNTGQGFAILGADVDYASGDSVSGAGDVNGDGYADVIIGTPSAYTEYDNVGISYVIFDSQGTLPPTSVPSISFTPTHSPTLIPTFLPTSPTFSPTLITESTWFTISSPVISFILSLIGGWILREKIAFHILSNWGYDFRLMCGEDNGPLQAGVIGFSLLQSGHSNIDKLICKYGNKKINVNLDDGNNNGLPVGIYIIIMQELRKPSSINSFEFLTSEKNKILNFLISQKDFIDFKDLGIIRGNIYQTLIKTEYKQKFEDKYKFLIRAKGEQNLDFSEHDTEDNIEELVITSNPMLESGITNAESSMSHAVEMLPHSGEYYSNFSSKNSNIAYRILTRAKELISIEQFNDKTKQIVSKHPEREVQFINKLAQILDEEYQELMMSASVSNNLGQLIENLAVGFYQSGEIFKVSIKVFSREKLFGISEKFENQPEAFLANVKQILLEVASKTISDTVTDANNHGNALLSIDAMMDSEHIRLQEKVFAEFGYALFGQSFSSCIASEALELFGDSPNITEEC